MRLASGKERGGEAKGGVRRQASGKGWGEKTRDGAWVMGRKDQGRGEKTRDGAWVMALIQAG